MHYAAFHAVRLPAAEYIKNPPAWSKYAKRKEE
jgi:hypothetical protein